MLANEKIQAAAKVSTNASVGFGGGTFFGGFMGFLDENAVAIGAGCAILTMLVNAVFRFLERKDRLKALGLKK